MAGHQRQPDLAARSPAASSISIVPPYRASRACTTERTRRRPSSSPAPSLPPAARRRAARGSRRRTGRVTSTGRSDRRAVPSAPARRSGSRSARCSRAGIARAPSTDSRVSAVVADASSSVSSARPGSGRVGASRSAPTRCRMESRIARPASSIAAKLASGSAPSRAARVRPIDLVDPLAQRAADIGADPGALGGDGELRGPLPAPAAPRCHGAAWRRARLGAAPGHRRRRIPR